MTKPIRNTAESQSIQKKINRIHDKSGLYSTLIAAENNKMMERTLSSERKNELITALLNLNNGYTQIIGITNYDTRTEQNLIYLLAVHCEREVELQTITFLA